MPDNLPELTAEERAAMDSLPPDFAKRLCAGERFAFGPDGKVVADLFCPRCRRRGPRGDFWSATNPRQGTLCCPVCWHQGYDILPMTDTEAAMLRAIMYAD